MAECVILFREYDGKIKYEGMEPCCEFMREHDPGGGPFEGAEELMEGVRVYDGSIMNDVRSCPRCGAKIIQRIGKS